jgi:glycosyltransferase involved in cell wall biosynthesis
MINSLLFICLSKKGFGGLELQMANKTAEWNSRNIKALLICYKNTPLHDYALRQNIPHKALHHHIEYYDPFTAWELLQIILQEQIQTCIIGLSRSLSISVMACRWAGKKAPSIIMFQQMILKKKKKDFLHRMLYKHIDAAIVPSDFIIDMLAANTTIPRDKIYTIPYGINTSLFSPAEPVQKYQAKELLNIPQECILMILPARFDIHKDQITALRAFIQTQNPDLHFLLVGNQDPASPGYFQECMNIIQTAPEHKKQNIHIMPFTDNFIQLLHAADIYVITSPMETFALALIQSMCCGLACIGSNSGGTQYAIQHKINGLLCQPQNADQFCEAMDLLADNPKLRYSLGANARSSALTHYDDQIIFNKTIQLLGSVSK